MPEAIEIICRGAARFVLVSEDEIADAMRAYFDDTHQVAEGAGSRAAGRHCCRNASASPSERWA